ncbi:MAG: lipoprotein signal peptidase [Pseudomonadales bacterium]|nr:lipoprotein signal peptidase [Pseudomonadales bacterium]MBO6564067.1 lipoprotein signal peptidase [Pseudomonadales bacterium]MBO6597989.1 lipoprotein signal peptidase [Pseudomonadales bacterium]MBO6822989.1 lipoprotein signal peptidase [Pseudomonadales bacterium]
MHYWTVTALIVALDQWSKSYMSELLQLCVRGRCESIDVLPIFKLTLLHNEGAAFSFLDDAGGWQRWFLVAVSSVVSAFISGWLWRVHRAQALLSWALCLILGGAIGNLIDRAAQGYVVDFLVFYYDVYYFPAFNVADAAISTGAVLLILDMIIQSRKERLEANG